VKPVETILPCSSSPSSLTFFIFFNSESLNNLGPERHLKEVKGLSHTFKKLRKETLRAQSPLIMSDRRGSVPVVYADRVTASRTAASLPGRLPPDSKLQLAPAGASR